MLLNLSRASIVNVYSWTNISANFTSSAGNDGGPLRVSISGEEQKRRDPMWLKTSLAALGLMGALAAATPAPTLAQGVYVGPGGVGIDTGRPGWRERHYRGHDDYAYERRFRGPGCRTVTIRRDDGSMKQIRRCD